MKCPSCAAEVLEIDVRCSACGTALSGSGAHRIVGSTVLGTYEVIDVLGQGGMSIVYKARHKITQQDVALKILPPELAAHSQVKSRFLEEARALATLDHANIVHLYNFGQENGCFVLAMQFVAGRTWERMILEQKRLDWQTSARVAVDVLRALEYAHGRGVIHRDMKPSNVLVRADDGAATVMDFGIAKMTTSTKLTATGQTMGTVRYMSPEQVRGHEVDPRTDLYSLAATIFESLTGDTPFDGNTHFEIMTKHLSEAPRKPSELGAAMPAVLEDAIMRALSKKAEDRFASAREMRKQIEAALREDPTFGETQRASREELNRALLETPVPPPPSSMSLAPTASGSVTPRAATPLTEMSDRITERSAQPRSSGLWIAVIGVLALAGGGGAAAYFKWLAKPSAATEPAKQQALVFEPGTVVSRADAETAYRRSLAAIEEHVNKNLPGMRTTIQRPLDKLVIVAPDQLCNSELYEIPVPTDCNAAHAEIASGPPVRTVLIVATKPEDVQAAMDRGVADAVCLFRAFAVGDASGDGVEKMGAKICDVLQTFERAPN